MMKPDSNFFTNNNVHTWKKIFLFSAILILFSQCSRLIKFNSSDIISFTAQAHRNIIKSLNTDSREIKDKLLNRARDSLKKAQSLHSKLEKKDPISSASLYWHYALFHLARDDAKKAQFFLKLTKDSIENGLKKLDLEKNSEKPRNVKEINSEIKMLNLFAFKKDALECRIYLIQADFSNIRRNFPKIKKAADKLPDSLLTSLTLADYQYLHGKLNIAQKTYLNILQKDKGLQSLSSKMLEAIHQIKDLQPVRGFFPLMIWTKKIQRDHLAFLLHLFIKSNKKIQKKLKPRGNKFIKFTDINSSPYKKEISNMVNLGFFSFIPDEKFQPGKKIQREEMAKIFEEFYSAIYKKKKYIKIFSKDIQSPIFDIKKDHPYYFAIRLGIDKKILQLALGNTFNPKYTVSGLEALSILNTMVKTFQ